MNSKASKVCARGIAAVLAMLLIGTAGAAASATESVAYDAVAVKAMAVQLVEGNAALVEDIASALWNYKEVGLAEYKSYVKVRDILAAAGFEIIQSAAGVPTALVAKWGSGKPVLGIYEDMDALPGVGHGCGHNLNTAAGVVAAMAIKSSMEASKVPGAIKLFITPAEEIWDVAPVVAGAGLYADVDVLISVHAGTENTSEFGSTMAMDHVEYKFKGVPAHSSAAPEKGISALDAVEIMNVAVNYLREHLIQEMRIHYVITDGGAAPNIVPATAASRWFIRGPKYPDVEYARERIDNCAKAAALATGATLEIGFSSGIYNKIPAKTLALAAVDVLKQLGPTKFAADDITALEAKGIKGVPNADVKEPTGGQSFGSNPIGDVTWNTPTTTITFAAWVPGTAGHSAESALQSGSVYGYKAAVTASKALASLGLEMITNPSALKAVKDEFTETMKGMPPYVGHAMIPAVAYCEAPGVAVSATGSVVLSSSDTAFTEKAGDVIIVNSEDGTALGSYTVSAVDAGAAEIKFILGAKVAAAQRLSITYIAAGGDTWFYGWVHAK